MPATLTFCPKIRAGESWYPWMIRRWSLLLAGECKRHSDSGCSKGSLQDHARPLSCAFVTTTPMKLPYEFWDSHWNQQWTGLDCNKNGSDQFKQVPFWTHHPRYILACGNPCCQCGASQYTGPAWCIARPRSPYTVAGIFSVLQTSANKCKPCISISICTSISIFVYCILYWYYSDYCIFTNILYVCNAMPCNTMQHHSMPCNAM